MTELTLFGIDRVGGFGDHNNPAIGQGGRIYRRIMEGIEVETDLFEHRNVKPHFINPNCFGEDFAGWLKQQLSPLSATGFTFSDPIQEDYGWGFWSSNAKRRFWIAISYVGDGPERGPARWIIFVDKQSVGLAAIKGLLDKKPDSTAFATVRNEVRHALKSNSAIRIVGDIRTD